MDSYIPDTFAHGTANVNGYNKNSYLLTPASGTSATPNSVTTIVLPEGSILDLHSFRVSFDCETNAKALSGDTRAVVSKVIGASQLVSRCEILISGRTICSINDFDVLSKIIQIKRGRDLLETQDRPLSHSYLSSGYGVDDVTLVLQMWPAFFGPGNCSARYFPSSLAGSVSVRLTWAPVKTALAVVGYETLTAGTLPAATSQASSSPATALEENDRALLSQLTYDITNIRGSIDCVSMPAYESLLQQRIASEGYLPIFIKNFQSTTSSIETSDTSVRWGVSTSSLDALYAVLRDSDFSINGNTVLKLDGVLSDSYLAQSTSFTLDRSSVLKDDALFQWSINSVQHPQYVGTASDALWELTRASMYDGAGSLVSSRDAFCKNMGVLSLTLQASPKIGVKSGYNTKGISSQLSLRLYNMNTASSTSQLDCFIFAQTTTECRVGPGLTIMCDE